MGPSIRLILFPFLLVLLAAFNLRAQGDLDLATVVVAPNVIILFDTSTSMNHHLWDDDFDASVVYPSWCGMLSGPTGTITYLLSSSQDTYDWTQCGVTRTLYHDKSTSEETRYDANYLNWLYTATPEQLANEPQQTRLQVAKQTMLDVVDSINPDKKSGDGYDERMRMGMAELDDAEDNGGYISVKPETGNKTALKAHIPSIRGNTATQLSETLADIGRFYAGANLLGSYPQYSKNDSGGSTGGSSDTPIDISCRKSFVIIMTDGVPTQDLNNHFGSAFMDTIGNADGDFNECSGLGVACTDAPSSGRDDGLIYSFDGTDWLDDVAFHLHNTDLAPQLEGTQNLVIYTIGFIVDHPLLKETAENGGGLYFSATNAGGTCRAL
jgi:type IV pilus assembly protein PilY1